MDHDSSAFGNRISISEVSVLSIEAIETKDMRIVEEISRLYNVSLFFDRKILFTLFVYKLKNSFKIQ